MEFAQAGLSGTAEQVVKGGLDGGIWEHGEPERALPIGDEVAQHPDERFRQRPGDAGRRRIEDWAQDWGEAPEILRTGLAEQTAESLHVTIDYRISAVDPL